MNYKIKITPENREAIKDIAERNGMNSLGFAFNPEVYFYEIVNGKFVYAFTIQKGEEQTILTFDQFKEMFDKQETEFQPKRGDRVLVWDDCEKHAVERIFLAEIKGYRYPVTVVKYNDEKKFIDNKEFDIIYFKHMKPILIEDTPTEPKKTFKDKVIELIDEKIKEYQKSENEYSSLKSHFQAQAYKDQAFAISQLLKEIKELN